MPREEARHAHRTAAIYQTSPHQAPKPLRDPATHAYRFEPPMSEAEELEMLHTMFGKPRKGGA